MSRRDRAGYHYSSEALRLAGDALAGAEAVLATVREQPELAEASRELLREVGRSLAHHRTSLEAHRRICDAARAAPGELAAPPGNDGAPPAKEEQMTDDEVRRAARDLTDAHGRGRAALKAKAHAENYPEGSALRGFWSRVRDEIAAVATDQERPPPAKPGG